MYEVFQATAELHGERRVTTLASAELDHAPVVYTHRELLKEINRAANMFEEFGVAGSGVISILSRSTPGFRPDLGAETAGAASCINDLLEPEAHCRLARGGGGAIPSLPGTGDDAEIWEKPRR